MAWNWSCAIGPSGNVVCCVDGKIVRPCKRARARHWASVFRIWWREFRYRIVDEVSEFEL